jgi:phenylalanyl-tRNA synthetase beta chain
MHGFDNFEPTPIISSFTGAVNQPDMDIDRRIREYLAFRCGMQEIFTYPWIDDAYLDALFPNAGGMLFLSAPPSPTERRIRASLLPGIVRAAADNLRFYGEFAIFESAQVFFDRDYKSEYDPREPLPSRRRHAAGALVGGFDDVNSLFRRAKGIIEALPRYTHATPLSFEKKEKPAWADGVLWLNVVGGEQLSGNIALLSKKASLDCGVKNGAVMLFELDIDALSPYPSRTNKFTRINEYPVTDYDLSLLFDLPVKWADIYDAVTDDSSGLLRGVSFVDEYRGRQIPDGKKSVTLRLTIGSSERTLTSDEIEARATSVAARLKIKFGAELRG